MDYREDSFKKNNKLSFNQQFKKLLRNE